MGGISGCLLIVLCWGGVCHLRIAAGRNWRQQDGDTGVVAAPEPPAYLGTAVLLSEGPGLGSCRDQV